ncbi:MAG: DUF5658 family protein [Metallosphaera sp.]|uniref:DUF5658 family protein n=1 Tax=Metallosphaera sp. TaxID=2020860 RepID=UPI00317AB417
MIQRLLVPILSGLGLMDILTTFIGIENGYAEQNVFLHTFQGNPFLFVLVMAGLKVVAIIGSAFLIKRSVLLPSLVLIGLFALADISNILTLI